MSRVQGLGQLACFCKEGTQADVVVQLECSFVVVV